MQFLIVDATRKRGTSEQARAVGFQRGKILTDRVRPIGIEQRRRGRCVRQCESIAGRPLVRGQRTVKPSVNCIERGAGLCDVMRIARAFWAERIAHDGLHRTHHVIVENAIEHPYRHGRFPRNDRSLPGCRCKPES